MLFEIYDKNKKRIMCTDYYECVPNYNDLVYMQKFSDYRFKYNGKLISLRGLKPLLNNIKQNE